MSDDVCQQCSSTGEIVHGYSPTGKPILEWCSCAAGHGAAVAYRRKEKRIMYETWVWDELRTEVGRARIFEMIKEVTGQDVCLTSPTISTEGKPYPW